MIETIGQPTPPLAYRPSNHLEEAERVLRNVQEAMGLENNPDVYVIMRESSWEIYDHGMQITIEGLDKQGAELRHLIEKMRETNLERDEQVRKIESHGKWETGFAALSVAGGLATAVATGGASGILMAAGSIFTAAQQTMSRLGTFKDNRELEKGLTFVSFAASLATFFMGGVTKVAKGAMEAQSFVNVIQSLFGVERARLEEVDGELRVSLQESNVQIKIKRLEREDASADTQTQLESAEKRCGQWARLAKLKQQIMEEPNRR